MKDLVLLVVHLATANRVAHSTSFRISDAHIDDAKLLAACQP